MTDPDHTRRRQAYIAGRDAFKQGKPREACRRQPGTIFFDDWHDGFNDAENEARKS